MAESTAPAPPKFDTFTGVFTPTLLTILGVIMFVRLPWVVGNGGILGSFTVMGLAMGITLCTGLSLSSISTNTRIGAGGPYAMIARSLGLEVGGSIGVPLYLSRPLGIAMYIFGFREGWLWIFPEHDPLMVDLIVFAVLFGLAYASADLAFRVQYLIMVVIAVSLVSVIATPRLLEPQGTLDLWGQYPGFPEDDFAGGGFWITFAVFFPATTGILAGANMSGDLADPRRSISRGTLWAIAVSCVVYFTLAVWASYTGSREELLSNYNFFIDVSFFGPGVLAGLLGATFSSALAGAVGGPRILMAMGANGIMPWSKTWAKTTKRGEPRAAVALTAVLTFGCLMMRDLNAIAPLVTMFFLITYLMINVVLLVEGGLSLASFRPSLRVPFWVPLLGAIGCIFTMFIVNPTFGLMSVGTSFAIYIAISRRAGELEDMQDVRSGIFAAFAEWAAAKVVELGGSNVRAWKPTVLVPLEDVSYLEGASDLIEDLCRPEGAVKLLGLRAEGNETLGPQLEEARADFARHGLFSTAAVVEAEDFARGCIHGLQALQGAFFRPNVLFMTLPRDPQRFEEFGGIIVQAHETGVGVLFFALHPEKGLGDRNVINLWVRRDRSGWDVPTAFENNNLDLMLLFGFRLSRAWADATLNVITVIPDEEGREAAEAFVAEVCDLARIPDEANHVVMVGSFDECAEGSPPADLNVLGLQADPDFEFMRKAINATGSACLFVADSGRESARA